MLQCSIPTGEASKARARVGLHGGLSPLERHECPQNDPIPASCGSTTACMSSSWPCIRTPSPMSSCPEARASPRAWASFLPSSHDCGADRSSPVHTSYDPQSDPYLMCPPLSALLRSGPEGQVLLLARAGP